MADPKPVASLTPTLLARKGGARPAIRTQQQFAQPEPGQDGGAADTPASEADPERLSAAARSRNHAGSKVVALNAMRLAAPAAKGNAVRRQRERLAEQVAAPSRARKAQPAKTQPAKTHPAKTNPASARGRASAFTLRLDPERHLRLRLATALTGRSAQNLVVEALDTMLASLPEVAEIAARAAKPR